MLFSDDKFISKGKRQTLYFESDVRILSYDNLHRNLSTLYLPYDVVLLQHGFAVTRVDELERTQTENLNI